MEFIKNCTVLIISTLTYFTGLIAIIALYMAITEQDIWYMSLVVIGAVFVPAILYVAKRFPRLQAALEYPFGILSL
jgi:hypothetical protein